VTLKPKQTRWTAVSSQILNSVSAGSGVEAAEDCCDDREAATVTVVVA
jgi:hypothetical protein